MTTRTINILTDYQLNELKELFVSDAELTKLGICQENGHIILEYIGWNGVQTRCIAKSEAEQIQLSVDKIKQGLDNTINGSTAGS